MDEAPDDSVILSNALRVADLVIIPVKPDRGSLKGLIVSVSKLLKMKDVNFDLKVLLTMINDNNNEKGIVNLFHKYFSGKTLDTTIRYRAKPANSATIQNEFLIDSDLNIGNDLKKLVDEVEVYFNDLSVHR